MTLAPRRPYGRGLVDARQALVDAAEGFLAGDGAGRERLGRAIQAAALEHLKARAPVTLAEDLAQVTAIRVLKAFAGGCTTPERLPAYVAAAARNALMSHRRKASSRREELTDAIDDEAPAEPGASPEEGLAGAQEARIQRERVRELVASMPAAYREVINRHYLEEQPIEALVEDEITARLTREGRDPGDTLARDAARLNARRTVDQRLSRARSWLAQRLAPAGGDA